MAYGQYDPYNVYAPGSDYEEGLSASDISAAEFGSRDSYLKNSADPFVSQWPDIKPDLPQQIIGSPSSIGGGGGGKGGLNVIGGGGGAGGSPSFSSSGGPNANLPSLGSKPFYAGLPRTVSTTGNILPPNIPMPTFPTNVPTYTPPAYDPKQVEALTEMAAGPGMRALRTQMREAQGKFYENPNVKRMTLRDALAGYGMGMESTMAGARSQAISEYQAQYAPEVTAAQMNYQAQMNQMYAQYQAALQNYMLNVQKQTMTQYAPQSQ